MKIKIWILYLKRFRSLAITLLGWSSALEYTWDSRDGRVDHRAAHSILFTIISPSNARCLDYGIVNFVQNSCEGGLAAPKKKSGTVLYAHDML